MVRQHQTRDRLECSHQQQPRSRFEKKNLARFPISILRVKVDQLLREHAHASLLNGMPVRTFTPNSQWFARWCEEYGLSLRRANRKYSVPKKVLQQRLELFWVSLFRVRQLAVLDLGYDPTQLNWDSNYPWSDPHFVEDDSLTSRGVPWWIYLYVAFEY